MAGAGASAGDDSIIADGDASGDDVVSGDAQAISLGGHAESQATNGDSTISGGSAGNDTIKTGGFGVTGDLVAGDSMAKGVSATAYGDNIALEAGAVSGDDTLTAGAGSDSIRSEEHTSELQSLMPISYAVFCL